MNANSSIEINVVVVLFFIKFCFSKVVVDPLQTAKSNIWIRGCKNIQGEGLFPLTAHPSQWLSCGYDAYEYTWDREGPNNWLLEDLSQLELLKLSRSMGFCPHLRCQLGELAESRTPGRCPEGLCYTRLQSGYPTFGACCFQEDGSFNSGELIGFYDLIRPIQKPIYKKNRIVLGDNLIDESRESFINANEVFPGLIVTDCPQDTTLQQFKRMLSQYNVTLVIQMHPHRNAMPQTDPNFCAMNPYHFSCRRPCFDWVTSYFGNQSGLLSEGIEQLRSEDHPTMNYVQYNYSLFQKPLKHFWYYNWEDFSIPSDNATLLFMAREAAEHLQKGAKVVISCYSGRGRSGTLAALIVGILHQYTTVSELVDSIVRMRESRDGLVELPSQFKYVQELLNLTASCAGLKSN